MYTRISMSARPRSSPGRVNMASTTERPRHSTTVTVLPGKNTSQLIPIKLRFCSHLNFFPLETVFATEIPQTYLFVKCIQTWCSWCTYFHLCVVQVRQSTHGVIFHNAKVGHKQWTHRFRVTLLHKVKQFSESAQMWCCGLGHYHTLMFAHVDFIWFYFSLLGCLSVGEYSGMPIGLWCVCLSCQILPDAG